MFGAANDRFGGCGSVLSIHEATAFRAAEPGTHHAYEVIPGVLRDDAVALLREFYARDNINGEGGALRSSTPMLLLVSTRDLTFKPPQQSGAPCLNHTLTRHTV